VNRAREWQGEWSPPASEVFVTTEVCHELAWELAHREPEVEAGAEEHLAGGPVREALPDESWEKVRDWVHQLAAEEEHQAWSEIVRYTVRRAKDIIRKQGFARDTGWDERRRYSEIASHVAQILAREYSLHAHPR
jgi:predicted nucleic acid-binding protein